MNIQPSPTLASVSEPYDRADALIELMRHRQMTANAFALLLAISNATSGEKVEAICIETERACGFHWDAASGMYK